MFVALLLVFYLWSFLVFLTTVLIHAHVVYNVHYKRYSFVVFSQSVTLFYHSHVYTLMVAIHWSLQPPSEQ